MLPEHLRVRAHGSFDAAPWARAADHSTKEVDRRTSRMCGDRGRRRRVPLRQIVALASCLALAGVTACGQPARHSVSATDSTCDGKLSGSSPTYITAWFHDS